MKIINIYILQIFIFSFLSVNAQQTSIAFELNGRSPNETLNNPFGKFIGAWTLKDNNWTQNWGSQTETIKIPDHHTISTAINTDNSLLSIIDGPEPNGHIFWSYNPNKKEVQHLSSFGTIRAGSGKGTINDNGDLTLKLSFEGEQEGSYRIYHYKWLNKDEYHMKSVQYDKNDKPTGLFYEGNFIRIKSIHAQTPKSPKDEIISILNTLDNNDIGVENQLHVYADDVVHMAPNHEVITNKTSLKHYLKEQRKHGYSKMKHHIINLEKYGDKILMRGAVTGTFYPSNGAVPFKFRTKNLLIFKRVDGILKIAKVIYNRSPNP